MGEKALKDMTKSEMVDLLRTDVKEWNRLRGKFPDFKPDLSKVYMDGSFLNGVNLRAANLSFSSINSSNIDGADLSFSDFGCAELGCCGLNEANLNGTNLYRANMSGAYINRSNLSFSILSGADLNHTSFFDSNLAGVNFQGANLSCANFGNANLSKAIFGPTMMALSPDSLAHRPKSIEVVLGNTSFKDAKNMDSCVFTGPCTIDLRTIRNSWPLPKSFLRGCGLDEVFIESLPSLLNEPVEFYSCFLSFVTVR